MHIILLAGPRSSYFTLKINHAGYFVDSGKIMKYASGHVVWYDQVDTVTWSALMLENIIEDMGYEMCGRITVHFHVPLMLVCRNRLMEIKDDNDCQAMLAYIQKGHHFLGKRFAYILVPHFY
jgi:hypothetical protein